MASKRKKPGKLNHKKDSKLVKKYWKSQGILSVRKSGDHVVSMKFVFTRSEWFVFVLFVLFLFKLLLMLVFQSENMHPPVRDMKY